MKSKISLITTYLIIATFLRADVALRPVKIHFTAADAAKEFVSPTVIVGDRMEARFRTIPERGVPVDVSVMPTLDGDTVRLTIRCFSKDKEGGESSTTLPVVITKLRSLVELRSGTSGYRIMATLGDSAPKKAPLQTL